MMTKTCIPGYAIHMTEAKYIIFKIPRMLRIKQALLPAPHAIQKPFQSPATAYIQ